MSYGSSSEAHQGNIGWCHVAFIRSIEKSYPMASELDNDVDNHIRWQASFSTCGEIIAMCMAMGVVRAISTRLVRALVYTMY